MNTAERQTRKVTVLRTGSYNCEQGITYNFLCRAEDVARTFTLSVHLDHAPSRVLRNKRPLPAGGDGVPERAIRYKLSLIAAGDVVVFDFCSEGLALAAQDIVETRQVYDVTNLTCDAL